MWILLWLFVTTSAFAQKVAPAPPSFDGPRVHEDRSVTFTLKAPRAQVVNLHGEWMQPGASEALRKQADGTWSVTVGPLPPDLYLYGFEVNGLRVPDPLNRFVKNGYPGLSSLLEVPGAESLAFRNVPHGTVRIHNYFSSVTKSARRLHVYTPPGYDGARRGTYPVLVLLHGSWDDDGAWIQVGRAGIVMDNLLAGKKAAPMLLVMPDGHPYPSFDVATRTRNLEALRRDLLEEIFPMVEKSYRVEKRPHGRAIAGFSMGGVQALHLGLRSGHFGSVGAFSAPGYIPSGPTLEDVLRQAQRLPQGLDLLWLACGRQDALFADAREVHGSLLKAGVRHVWREVEGDHTWMVWRRNLAEFAQLLFVSN